MFPFYDRTHKVALKKINVGKSVLLDSNLTCPVFPQVKDEEEEVAQA